MEKNFIQPPPVADAEAQRISALRRAANAAADAAEKAWHEYASALDVGADRTRAFAVYDSLRLARFPGR
jgi:hypothetical protein